jgi:ferrochelatase
MIGVMLANSGTAEEPTEEAVRDHLRRFLSDRNLISVPRVIWKPILEHAILPKRPKETLYKYQEFWTPEGSPFMIQSREQTEALQRKLDEAAPGTFTVELAMRYDPPFIADALDALLEKGAQHIVVMPMYPQYNHSCTYTIFEAYDIHAEELRKRGDVEPGAFDTLKISEYWDAPGYIQALADSVRRVWTPQPGGKLLCAYHSEPESFIKKGDTYQTTVEETTRRLADALGMRREDVVTAYHCQFDKRSWIGPMVEPAIRQLVAEGVRDLAVVSPIFAAECLETEFDSKREAREIFEKAVAEADAQPAEGDVDSASGEGDAHPACRFTYVPCLGADDAFIQCLSDLVMTRVRGAGWLE